MTRDRFERCQFFLLPLKKIPFDDELLSIVDTRESFFGSWIEIYFTTSPTSCSDFEEEVFIYDNDSTRPIIVSMNGRNICALNPRLMANFEAEIHLHRSRAVTISL